MSHVINAVETEQDKVEGTAFEPAHRPGITNLEREMARISRKPFLALLDHGRGVVGPYVFANPFGKMESCAAAADAQIQHCRCGQFGEHQAKNGFLRRLQIGFAGVTSSY